MTVTSRNEKAIVARGRSLRGVRKVFREGDEVELPGSEVKALRASGFLVDPKAAQTKHTKTGPEFSNDRNVSIQRA